MADAQTRPGVRATLICRSCGKRCGTADRDGERVIVTVRTWTGRRPTKGLGASRVPMSLALDDPTHWPRQWMCPECDASLTLTAAQARLVGCEKRIVLR